VAEDLCYDDGSALQTLHDQVYGGPGVPVVESASRALGVLEPWVTSSSGRIQQSLRGAGVDWHGQAADATAAALQKVGQWADRGGQATGAGGGRVQDYASSFAEMKPKIVAPAQVPDLTNWGRVVDIFGNNSDHARVIHQNREAEAAAFAAYAAHERNTQRAIADFPSVDQVPTVANAAGTAPIHAGATSPAQSGPGGGRSPGTAGSGAAAHPGTRAHANPGGAAPGTGGSPHPAGGPAAGSTPGEDRAGPGGTGPGGGAPVTAPSSWTPLNPASTGGPPPPGLPPAGLSPSSGPGLGGATPSPTADLPPLPPMTPTSGYPHSGAGRLDTGSVSTALGDGEHPLAPRGGGGLAGRTPAGAAEPAGAGVGATSGPGGRGTPGTGSGTPMGGAGAGAGGQDREHRNTTFIPSDEPYVVELDDDVVPAVLGDGENRP
jgi:hypothetical protein